MSHISNDAEFKQALQGLDFAQQRKVAAMFVEHVLALSHDERLNRVVKVAGDSKATADDLSGVLESAKAATMDSYTRCGADGNWTQQAGYFVARAAVATVTPENQSKAGGPAWQAAMSCRMAQTSLMIDNDSSEIPLNSESEWQYHILSSYLHA